MRYKFSDLFTVDPSGRVSPKQSIQYGRMSLTPGVSIGPGVSLNGLDLAPLAGQDLEAEQVEGVYVISKFYDA